MPHIVEVRFPNADVAFDMMMELKGMCPAIKVIRQYHVSRDAVSEPTKKRDGTPRKKVDRVANPRGGNHYRREDLIEILNCDFDELPNLAARMGRSVEALVEQRRIVDAGIKADPRKEGQ